MVKRAVTLAAAVGGMMLLPVPTEAMAKLSPTAEPSAAARADIPPGYLTLYIRAARTCPGLPWQVLAAIGSIESDHGRSGAPGVHGPAGHAGPEGPMQFEPATFATYAVRADRGHPVSPYNPADAIYSAARMLCAAGAAGGSQSGLSQAIYAYNHSGWYVKEVLNLAARYSGRAVRPAPTPAVRPAPTPAKTGSSARPRPGPVRPPQAGTPATPGAGTIGPTPGTGTVRSPASPTASPSVAPSASPATAGISVGPGISVGSPVNVIPSAVAPASARPRSLQLPTTP